MNKRIIVITGASSFKKKIEAVVKIVNDCFLIVV